MRVVFSLSVLALLIACSSPDEESDSAATNTVDASATISIADFERIVGDDWRGELTYADYSSDRIVSIPIEISVNAPTGNTLTYAIRYPEEPQYNSVETLEVSADGRSLDGQPVVERSLSTENVLRVVTAFRDTDNNEPADVQLIYELAADRFAIAKQVSPVGEQNFSQRNRYQLIRH